MIVYRMFATECNHRECVRIFKPSQLVNVKQFMRKYCLESECGTTVEKKGLTNPFSSGIIKMHRGEGQGGG